MSARGAYDVVVSAGSLRPQIHDGVVMSHRWTPEGVVVEAEFTGAHLYHLAAAGCVVNDVYREAGKMGIKIDGARVTTVSRIGGPGGNEGVLAPR